MRWSEWTGKRSSVSAFDDGRVSAFGAFWRLIARSELKAARARP
jgi:hypothetical protein